MGLWSKIRGDVFGSLAGGIIGSVFGGQSAKKQAALQRQNWSYAQSNAHQFEVNDLKAAGLNPILSATNSQIAGMGSAPSTSDNGITSAFSASLSKALDRQANLDIAKTNAEIARINADTERIKAGIRGDDTSAANSRFDAETDNIIADTGLKKSNSDYLIGETANSAKRTEQDIKESNQRIEEIKQNIANSVRIVNKQLEVMDSQKAMNYAQANLFVENLKKIASDIGVNDAMIAKLEQEKESIIADLTNPQKVLERKTWEEAARGENALGIVHRIMMPVKEFTSSIGLTLAPRLGPTYVNSVKAVQK